ncbi:MAG: hypothetical protein KDC49_15410 [Saprospiraceae bacterium]|nr:hypothetical protein [Saprospiraceae bacterium]
MKKSINIDALFKRKLSNAPQDFVESDWLEMEKMLDQDKRKKRIFLPFHWLAIGTAAALLCGFVLFKKESQQSANPNAEPSKIEETYAKNAKASDSESFNSENSQSTSKNLSLNDQKIKTQNNTSLAGSIPDDVLKLQNKDSEKTTDTPLAIEEPAIDLNKKVEKVTDTPPRKEQKVTFNYLQELARSTQELSFESPQIHFKKEYPVKYSEFEPHLSLGLGLEAFASPSGFGALGGGILANYHITEEWAITTGFKYFRQANANIYSRLRQDESFGFGSSTVTYGLHGDQISFLSAPLGISHRRDKMLYGIGIYTDFLLGVQGEVRELELMPSTERSKVREIVHVVSSGWLDVSGFRKTNGRIYMSASRILAPGLQVGIDVNYRPWDVLKDQPELLERQSADRLFFGVNLQMFMP